MPEMKKFIKRLVSFAGLLGMYFLIIAVCTSVYACYNSSIYRLDPSVKTLFAGDSHIEQAIDDRLLPNCKNIGRSAETYLFTFYKLKKILSRNPGISAVNLGIGCHNFSAKVNHEFTDGRYAATISPAYFYALPAAQQLDVLKWNVAELPLFFRNILKSWAMPAITGGKFPIVGGYPTKAIATRVSEKEVGKRIAFQYFNSGKISRFSTADLQYLDSIIFLCRSRNIKLSLLSTPVHPSYHSKVPNAYQSKLKTVIMKCRIAYTDFSTLALTDDCYLPDGDHLSAKGVKLLAYEIKKINP